METQPGTRDDARSVAKLAHQCAANWVVVDGYQFDGNYRRELKAAGLRVLFVDDSGDAGYCAADLLLNQNAHADACASAFSDLQRPLVFRRPLGRFDWSASPYHCVDLFRRIPGFLDGNHFSFARTAHLARPMDRRIPGHAGRMHVAAGRCPTVHEDPCISFAGSMGDEWVPCAHFQPRLRRRNPARRGSDVTVRRRFFCYRHPPASSPAFEITVALACKGWDHQRDR